MIVAISGFAGTGKTTLSALLKEALERGGLKVVLYTPTLRDLAAEKGISLLELQEQAKADPRIDLDLDETTRRRAEELSREADVVILASWLAVFVLRDAFKVFLYAPLEVRAKRVAERDGVSVEEALAHIQRREQQNRERWRKLYGLEMDKLHEYAHIALNTGLLSLDEEVALLSREVLDRLERGA